MHVICFYMVFLCAYTMCVCVCTSGYVIIYARMHVCMYARLHVCLHAIMPAGACVCTQGCMPTCCSYTSILFNRCDPYADLSCFPAEKKNNATKQLDNLLETSGEANHPRWFPVLCGSFPGSTCKLLGSITPNS